MARAPQTELNAARDLLQRREILAALEGFTRAESCGAQPDECSAGRWMVYMLLGDFEAAWRESDAIRQRGAPDPHRFWQGEVLDRKRIILRALHGLGDAVQLLRYAPALKARAAHLIVEVPPAMLELAGYFKGVDDVITWGEQAPSVPPQWDVQIEINELPYIFRTQAGDLPGATNYLQLPDALLDRTPLFAADPLSLRVGVVWASSSWNSARSVPFDLLRPLFATEGCEFWNLQGGAARSQWVTRKESTHLHRAEECAGSIARLAALIAQLDLVITSDTLAAHLAGALGTPAWVMLAHEADWRWQHERVDSPWYPSLRLFRQPEPGDWKSVTAQLTHLLRRHAASLNRRRLVA